LNQTLPFSSKSISLGNEIFSIRILKFDNGYFVSVSQGPEKIGSLVASISGGPVPTTTTIIPSKNNFLFSKLISEQISDKIKGIALVSTFLNKELEISTGKALMLEILEMIQND
jgi:hypothetical protein